MGAVDVDWMREKLEEYHSLCERYDALYRQAGYDYSDECRRVDREAQLLQPTVERILGRLDPELQKDFPGLGYTSGDPDRRVRQGLGLLKDREDLERRLAPDAPSLVADRLSQASGTQLLTRRSRLSRKLLNTWPSSRSWRAGPTRHKLLGSPLDDCATTLRLRITPSVRHRKAFAASMCS